MNKVFAVGVGPGSPKYVTDIVKDAISQCDVVIGYGYTIKTIEEYVKGKRILEVTMQNQENSYSFNVGMERIKIIFWSRR